MEDFTGRRRIQFEGGSASCTQSLVIERDFPKAKLRRLRVNRLPGIEPSAELFFNERMNVLLGRNGTGKTRLLQLIAMVVGSDFSGLEGQRFDLEYELAWPGLDLLVTLRNEPVDDTLPWLRGPVRRGEIPTGPGRAHWSYEVVVWGERVLGTYRVKATPLSAHWSFAEASPGDSRQIVPLDLSSLQVTPLQVVSPFVPMFLPGALEDIFDDIDERLKDPAQSLWVADITLNFPEGGVFDEGLGGFAAMTGGGPGDGGAAAVRGPAMLFLRGDGNQVNDDSVHPVPQDLSDYLTENPEAFDAANPTISHLELDFLYTAIELFQFARADLHLRLRGAARRPEPDARSGLDYTYHALSFTFTLDDGSLITHEALSHGQKRLLSFLYYLEVTPHVVLAEDLPNGLHPVWLAACLKAIGDRQCFMTTQSPVLLDNLSFASADEVRSTFVLCRRERVGGKTVLRWHQMTQGRAERVFREYQEHPLDVSSILTTHELW